MPIRIEVKNPKGKDTSSEYVTFPDFFPFNEMENVVREKFPDKHWPEELPVLEEDVSLSKGFWERFWDAGWEAHDQAQENFAFGTAILNTSESEAKNYLEYEYQKWRDKPTDPKHYPIRSPEFFGETFGSVARDIGVGIATGVAAGMVTTPLGGIITGGGVVASMQGVTAKGGSFRNTYFGERYKQDEEGNPNIEDAYETARKVSNADSVAAVAEAGAAIMIPVPGVGKGFTRVATRVGNELLFDATIGASGSAISDAYAVSEGVDRGDRWENAYRSGLQEVIGGAIPTGMRGVTQWGRYVTELRAAQQAIDLNNKDIDRLVVDQSETNDKEKKEEIAEKIQKKETQIERAKEQIKQIQEDKSKTSKTLSYDWENPTAEPVFLPEFDENGLLTSAITATPAQIEFLSNQDKVPNTFSEEFTSYNNEPFRATLEVDGENYEVFKDGSISPYPIREEVKIVDNADKSIDSLNKGGETSPRFKAPIPTTRSWKEFVEEFGFSGQIKGAETFAEGGIPDVNTETFVQRYTLEDNDTLDKKKLAQDWPVFGLAIHQKDLPDKISDAIKRSDHIPPFMNSILNDLALGKKEIEQEEGKPKLVVPEINKIQFHSRARGNRNFSLPIAETDFKYNIPTKLSPEGTRTFAEQLKGQDFESLRMLIRSRENEIKENAIEIRQKTNIYIKEFNKLMEARKAGRISPKVFQKRLGELGAKTETTETITRAISVPSEEYAPLFPFISHPEDKKIGPYPHYGDYDKRLVDFRPSVKLYDPEAKGVLTTGFIRGKFANLDDPYSMESFKRILKGGLADFKKRSARISKEGSLVQDPNWKWTDSKIKDFIKEFHDEVGRSTPGFRTEGIITVNDVKEILAGKDPFSDTVEDTYYISAEKELAALERLEDALVRTEVHHFSELAEAIAQEVQNEEISKAEGALDSLAFGLHQPGMVDIDNFDYMAFSYHQLKIAQLKSDAEARGEEYIPPPVIAEDMVERVMAQGIVEGKPKEERGKFDLDFVNVTIGIKELDTAKEFYANKYVLPAIPKVSMDLKGVHPLEESAVLFTRKLNADFAVLEKRLQNVLKWLWYTDTSKWVETYTKGKNKGKPNPNKIRFRLPKKLQFTTVEETGKPQEKPLKYLGDPGDIKSSMYKSVNSNLNKIETYIKQNKKADFNKIEKAMLSDLQPAFDSNNETINEFLKLVHQQKEKTSTFGAINTRKLSDTRNVRRYMRDILAGFNALGKMRGVLYANMFFNPNAIPQIYSGLVGLAAHLKNRGIANVKEFAKAIGSNVNAAVQSAWNDGVKGIYRTMYNLPWKVLKEIIRMLTPSRDTIEKMVPPALLEWSDSQWETFYDKHKLEQYKDDKKKGFQLPAVKALIKRNYIDKYYDLADIMARVGTGLTGENLDKRLLQIKDSVNAYYKIDALETILGERMTNLNAFQDQLYSTMSELKIDPIKLADYLKARHAPSRNARIAEINPAMATPDKPGSGMTNERAKEIIEEITREGKLSSYDKIATEFIDYVIRESLDITVEGGLITQEAYQRLQTHYEHYIPLRGKEDSDEVIQVTGNGIEAFGPEWQAALGRSTEAPSEQVLPYIFQQYFNAVYRAEKNRVAQSLRKFVIENPNKEIKLGSPDYIRRLTKLTDEQQIVQMVNNPLWYKGKDILALKVEGKNKYLRIKNPALAHELKGSGTASLREWTRGTGVLTKGLAKLHTQYNPSFILPNFIRDLQFAKHHLSANQTKELSQQLANIWNLPALISPLGRKKKGVIHDAFKAIWKHTFPEGRVAKKEITDPNELAIAEKMEARLKEMIEYGGRISFYGFNTFEGQIKTIQKLSKKLNNANKNNEPTIVSSTAKDLIGWFKETIEGVNGSFETATRLATYSLLRDYGFTPQQASYGSRNITVNFTKKGKHGAALNDMFMFFNPGIQGSYNLYKVLKHTDAGKKIFFNIFAAGFLREALNQAISDEDEEGISYYDKIPEWKRKHNMILMNPFTGRQALAIPMPYGYNVIDYMGQKAMQVARDGYLRAVGGYAKTDTVPNAMRPAEAAMNIMSAAANAFNPIGGDSNLAKMVTPDILDPWIADLPSNRDWKGATIVPEPSPFAPYQNPKSERYWQTVGTPFKVIARTINKLPVISGGNEVISGHLDFSPEALEHLTEYYTGGAGKFTVNFYKLLEKMATGKEIIANDVPITRRFVAAPSSFYELEKFKELREKSYQATDLYKLYREAGRTADAKHHKELNKVLFKIQGSIKGTESRIREINKHMRKTSASKSLSYIEKTARLRRLKQLKTEAMRKTHAKFIQLVDPLSN